MSTLILAIIISGHLLLSIPQTTPAYVSGADNIVTQSLWADVYGAVGLLAHNDKAGQYFDDLAVGDTITVLSKAGSKVYEVVEIRTFKVVSGKYRDLYTGDTLSSRELMKSVYCDGCVVLQTCVAKDDDPAWGRLFLVAKEEK